MKKNKKVITNFVLIGIAALLCILLSVVPFIVPGTFYKFKGFANGVNLGRDFDGGVIAIYESETQVSKDDFNKFKSILSKKSNIVKQSDNKLIVDIANAKDPVTVLSFIGKDGFFEIKTEQSDTAVSSMDSKHIDTAEYLLYNDSVHGIKITFTDEGSSILQDITSSSETLYFYMGGKTFSDLPGVQISEPVTTGMMFLTGNITSKSQGQDIANRLMAGKYSKDYTLVNASSYESTMQEGAIMDNVFLAIQIGYAILLVALIAFLCIRYRHLGIIASVSFIFFSTFILAAMSIISYIEFNTATIIAMIIGYAIAIFSTVFLFESFRKENEKGKKLPSSIRFGFKAAYPVILDISIALGLCLIAPLFFAGSVLSSFALTLVLALVGNIICTLGITYGMSKMYLKLNSTKPEKVGFAKGEVGHENE